MNCSADEKPSNMAQSDFALTLRAMGVSESDIAQALAVQYPAEDNNQDNRPEIQPGNWLIVQLFFQVGKYWERVGMEANPISLDPLKIECRASKLTWYRRLDETAMELLWDGLEIMENACLTAWSDKRKEASETQ